jgi:aminopeptidase 2
MCRHQFGPDVDGAAIDISHGRQVLPTNVKPIHYHLTLEPDFETFKYEGKVVIEYVPRLTSYPTFELPLLTTLP